MKRLPTAKGVLACDAHVPFTVTGLLSTAQVGLIGARLAQGRPPPHSRMPLFPGTDPLVLGRSFNVAFAAR